MSIQLIPHFIQRSIVQYIIDGNYGGTKYECQRPREALVILHHLCLVSKVWFQYCKSVLENRTTLSTTSIYLPFDLVKHTFQEFNQHLQSPYSLLSHPTSIYLTLRSKESQQENTSYVEEIKRVNQDIYFKNISYVYIKFDNQSGTDSWVSPQSISKVNEMPDHQSILLTSMIEYYKGKKDTEPASYNNNNLIKDICIANTCGVGPNLVHTFLATVPLHNLTSLVITKFKGLKSVLPKLTSVKHLTLTTKSRGILAFLPPNIKYFCLEFTVLSGQHLMVLEKYNRLVKLELGGDSTEYMLLQFINEMNQRVMVAETEADEGCEPNLKGALKISHIPSVTEFSQINRYWPDICNQPHTKSIRLEITNSLLEKQRVVKISTNIKKLYLTLTIGSLTETTYKQFIDGYLCKYPLLKSMTLVVPRLRMDHEFLDLIFKWAIESASSLQSLTIFSSYLYGNITKQDININELINTHKSLRSLVIRHYKPDKLLSPQLIESIHSNPKVIQFTIQNNYIKLIL